MIKQPAILLMTLVGLAACSSNGTNDTSVKSAHAPVRITHIRQGTISDSVSLSATTYYLSNNEIAAPVSGYITKGGFKPGDHIKKGDVLFEIKTREARALQSGSDTSSFSSLGNIAIKSSSDGLLTSVLHVEDDYVQEGGMLARVVKTGNFYLKLFVPHEYSSVIQNGRQLNVPMPDGRIIAATVTGMLNQADPASQSVVWLLKPDQPISLPEGLNVTVPVVRNQHKNTQLLPKEAILADESLQSFWVMKVLYDSLAVRVPVTKGIETAQQVEILAPHFSPSDNIVISGQYGLEDSSLVQITTPGL